MNTVAGWLSRTFSKRDAAPDGALPPQPEAVSHRPRGFAEAPLKGELALLRGGAGEADDMFPLRPERLPFQASVPGDGPPADAAAAQPFASTGPQGHRARMREKLLERGPDSLADYELLEMLLFFAFKQGDTKPLAKALINQFGSFGAVLAAPQKTLMESRGLGPHSVAALKLVQAAALRLAKAEVMEAPVLNNWDRLITYLNAAISREKIEQFRILFLDSKNRLIADEAQAKGTVNHTPVYPREVMKRALELHATALILVHNHPSGDPTPSRADIEMTAEIKQAGQFFAVVVHDHLIVGNGRYLSFRREGLL
ncbi:RadC family protein [Teichococcus vastitatis]|uniref:DNA repair protein RadC n=1 Tax=Teichococcus vastitatis TaxID=2307076 RepID=A0ABS9W5S0_9PROT|nr:DNA repair protein RadC [Pseudoroseomonas vastitatis]MCI0754632.1 DNA repair protein RadC [Pseudoroseomonas vastitatis]